MVVVTPRHQRMYFCKEVYGCVESAPQRDVYAAASHDFWRLCCRQRGALDLAPVRFGAAAKLMSIQDRCLRQRPLADRAFMDFKYTPACSQEQLSPLARLHALIL